MNVTVRFGAVAVLKRRFRFMRFGFSFGSCVQFAVIGGSNPLVPKALRTTHFGASGEWPRRHAGEYTVREFGA